MSSSPQQVQLRAAAPAQAATAAPVRSRVKRALDVAVAAALLLVALPLLALIAIAIKLDSRGPVLFRQQRVGLGGKPFTMLKFRSMRVDSDDGRHRDYVAGLVTGAAEEANGGGVFKLVGDDRVTRVGTWLRRTSLDEVPQLWNVLRGEMSLVGPRPPLPYEVERYEGWQMRRLACRPGLTGLWQVSGRSQLTYRKMCELDIEYIQQWSHGLDLRILLKTIPVVLRNSGNAH